MWACQATVLFKHIDEGFIRRGAAELVIMEIKVGTSSPYMPSTIHECTHHRNSSKEALHIERTHDKAQCRSAGDSHRCASIHLQLDRLFILWQIKKRLFTTSSQEATANSGLGKDNFMDSHAQVVTPLETMESFDSEIQLLARNKLVMSFRLCRTARLDLASAWNEQRSVSHSTTAPMSSTACVSARGTFQKTGRKSPRSGFSWVTNLPKFQLVPLNVTNSEYRTPTTV